MTDTIQLQGLNAIVAALNADLPSDMATATKGQWFPGEPVRETEIRVFFFQEDAQAAPGRLPLNRDELVVAIQIVVAAEESAECDDAIEPIRAHITGRLGDTNLGGLIHEITYRGTKWERARLELVYAWATMGWLMRFQTHRADLTRRS